MAETTRLVDYYYIQVAQKVGEGAKVLRALKDGGKPNSISFPPMPRHSRARRRPTNGNWSALSGDS